MSDDGRREPWSRRLAQSVPGWSGRFSVGLVRDVGQEPPRSWVGLVARLLPSAGLVLGGAGAGCRTGAAEIVGRSGGSVAVVGGAVLGGIGAGSRTRAAQNGRWLGAEIGRAGSRWGWCGMSDGRRRERWQRRVVVVVVVDASSALRASASRPRRRRDRWAGSVARCRRWSGRFSVALLRDVGREPPRTVGGSVLRSVGPVLGGVGAECRTGAAENGGCDGSLSSMRRRL